MHISLQKPLPIIPIPIVACRNKHKVWTDGTHQICLRNPRSLRVMVKDFFVAGLIVKGIVLTTNKGQVLKTPTRPDETSGNYTIVVGQSLMYLSGNTDIKNAHFPHLTFTFNKCSWKSNFNILVFFKFYFPPNKAIVVTLFTQIHSIDLTKTSFHY